MILLAFITACQVTSQAPKVQVYPADLLHKFIELKVGEEPATYEITADFDGTLHIWAESREFDPKLTLKRGDGEALEDDNSGGGTTACIELGVTPGEVLVALVGTTGEEQGGRVRLHRIASPETVVTRDVAKAAIEVAKEADSRNSSGDLDGARMLLDGALSTILKTEGFERSHALAEAAWSLGFSAHRSEDVKTCNGFWGISRAHRERTLPEAHPSLLHATLNFASTARVLGDLPVAHALLKSVLEARERTLPEDHPQVLSARQNLALTMRQEGDLTGARRLFESVLEVRERLLPEDHPHLLDARLGLACTMREMGDLAGARGLEESVLEVRKRLLPGGHPDLLAAREGLACTMREMGDLAEARTLFEAVLEARERLLPKDHPRLLDGRQNLANVMAQMGNLAGARALEEAVLEARERLFPVDHPDLITARNNLAATMQEMGDLGGARALKEAVLEARQRLLPEDHPALLSARGNLAITMREMGDVVGARALEEAVLEARERLFPQDHPDLLIARQNLAVTMRALGDPRGARELLEAVLEARQRLLPEDHPALLSARGNLAITMREMGDVVGARALEEAVLEARESLLPEDHHLILASRQNLSVTLRQMGDVAGARTLSESVLEARERLLPGDHPDLLSARMNLAFAMRETGDFSSAGALGEEFARSLLLRVEGLSILSPREIREAAGADTHWLSMASFFIETADSGEGSPLIYRLIETWRHVLSLPIKTASVGDPELKEALAQILNLRERLSDIVAGGASEDQSPEEYADEVSRLSFEKDRFQRKLRADLIDQGVLTRNIGAGEVAKCLPEGAISIGFRQLEGWRQSEETGAVNFVGEGLVAYVVRADGVLRRFDLGAVTWLEALVRAWRAELGKPVIRGVSAEPVNEVAESAAGTALRVAILDPLLGGLDEDTTQLHVCADGLLHLVPLDALPLGQGRVGDHYKVVNEASLARLIAQHPPPEDEPTMLVLGGAQFDAVVARSPGRPEVGSAPIEADIDRSGVRTDFGPLLQTSFETEAVSALFKVAADRDAVLMTGKEATKAAFHKHAPGKRFLHIATHGWFAPESVPSILDDRGGDDLWTRMSARATVTGLAPSTLCGLAFAGANHGRDSLGRVPGIMTAEELMGIDLSACELAVLSACETNVGIRRAGQGIQSLQSALHAAGVRTAITSLWKVDDAATRKLFERFYTYFWVEKMGKADALWKAKCDLRAEGHPVRDWGAWVLSGDPE